MLSGIPFLKPISKISKTEGDITEKLCGSGNHHAIALNMFQN